VVVNPHTANGAALKVTLIYHIPPGIDTFGALHSKTTNCAQTGVRFRCSSTDALPLGDPRRAGGPSLCLARPTTRLAASICWAALSRACVSIQTDDTIRTRYIAFNPVDNPDARQIDASNWGAYWCATGTMTTADFNACSCPEIASE
jgi:hypothetical protein